MFDFIEQLDGAFTEVHFQRAVICVSHQQRNFQLLYLLLLDDPGPGVEDLLLVVGHLPAQLLVFLKDLLSALAVTDGMVEVFETLR